MKRTTRFVACAFLTLAASASLAYADERVYVVENGAAIRLHGLTFNGVAFSREDLNPSSPQAFLSGGSEPNSIATTDRLLLGGTSSQSLGLNVFDPVNGIELPRVGTTVIHGRPVVSANQEFAYLVGNSASGAVVLSVVDLRPASAMFLKETAALMLAASGLVPTNATTLGPSGQFLYTATTLPSSSPDKDMKITVVNLANPEAPTVQATYTVPQPVGAPWPSAPSNSGLNSLSAFEVAGKGLLFASRLFLYVMEIQADGSLATASPGVASAARLRSFQCPTSACSGGSLTRSVRNVYAAETPSGPRAFLTTDRSDTAGPNRPQVEEVLVLDLTGITATAASDDLGNFSGITTRVRRIEMLATGAGGDSDALLAGPEGSLFVVSPGLPRSESATITAINLAALAVTTGGPSSVISPVRECISEPGHSACFAPAGESYSSERFSVRGSAFQSPPPPSISRLLVDGSPNPILVNDAAHTLAIEGSGLAATRHVFVGLDRLCLNDPVRCPSTVVTDELVTAVSEPLLPSSNRAVAVVDASGSIGVSYGLTVANSPSFLPAHVVYGLAFGDNAVFRFQSASSARVNGSFPSFSAPSRGSVSSDGRWLYASAFRGGRVAVHSIVADPERGYDWDQEITGGGLFIGGAPQSHALDDQPGRNRKRLYATSINGSIAMIDTGAIPPTIVDTDGNPSTTDDADYDPSTTTDQPLPSGATKVSVIYDAAAGGTETRATNNHASAENRGLCVSADGHWLYVARNGNPHLVAINVSDDIVANEDRTFISLVPGAPGGPIASGGSPAPGGGRADGMALVGSKLYYASSLETKIRVFNVAGPVLTLASPVSEIPLPGPLPSTRNLAALPDGRFLYATSRSGGKVDIIDLATDTWVASTPTGVFTEGVSPAPDSRFVYVGSGERDIMWTIDAQAGSPTLHQRIASFGGGSQLGWVIAAPGVETPAGESVPVQPNPTVALTFDSVVSAGNTAVTSANVSALSVPTGFSILNVQNPVYYEIKTTASFTGLIKVCLNYSDDEVQGVDESTLRFMHEEAGVLRDRTIGSPDTDPGINRICGEVSSFSAVSLAVASDIDPPTVSCTAADGLWHADNVAIECTAWDLGSGLPEGSSAAFALLTNVPVGTETANASTDTRLICDRAGNCAAAGPVGGNRIDRRGPTVNISSPVTGSYTVGQAVLASYSCADGGSGAASCSGTVQNGAPLPSATTGSHTFSVTGIDVAGNSSTASASYSVAYGLCLLYNPQKVSQAGSTIPIRLQLCDAAGNNVSSPSVGLTATSVFLVSTNAAGELEGSGGANPDFNFRYTGGAYAFNLKSTGFSPGTYGLSFTATGDPTSHTLQFRIR